MKQSNSPPETTNPKPKKTTKTNKEGRKEKHMCPHGGKKIGTGEHKKH